MNARRYVEDGLVQVLLWTGLGQDEAEAREIAAEAIVEDPNLYRDRSLVVELEAVDPDKGDRYRMHISLEGDPGEISEYRRHNVSKISSLCLLYETLCHCFLITLRDS